MAWLALLFAFASEHGHPAGEHHRHAHARATMPTFRSRAELPHILEQLNLTNGVELGVERGIFSAAMLGGWPSVRQYTMADLWSAKALKGTTYVDPQSSHDSKYAAMRAQRLVRGNCSASFGDAIARTARSGVPTCGVVLDVCRNYTTSCAAHSPDESVDFVYLDALHDYAGVMQDLVTWWPKVSHGGIMAGHDYYDVADFVAKKDQAVAERYRHNFDGTYDRDGRLVKGAVDDFFGCVSAMRPQTISSSTSPTPDTEYGVPYDAAPTAKGEREHPLACEHLRQVVVAYGSPGSPSRGADSDNWPRTWAVRK